jgi:hypothetical protein
MLHPSVDDVGYIVKALWIPGSQYELVLVSDSFVKIYDTRVDVISPTYYFILDEGTIKDATVAVSDEVCTCACGGMREEKRIPRFG